MGDASRDITSAVHDFYRARRRANLQEALAYLAGGSNSLLSYEEVRRKLRAVEGSGERLEEVPLEAIVGSDKDRWANVRAAMVGMEGVPPIEVYRIGDAYFVKDGNHRVSVARQLGAKYIQAYVTPVRTRVPLDAQVRPDDLIIKAEYADFLETTGLDQLRPDADLTVTVPGQYDKLLEHISVHRYFMGIDEKREVSYPEAVAHWHDTVYRPVVESIRRHRLLRGFEGRTETDLYLWLAEHRGVLERELGWSLPSETIAEGLGGGPKIPVERREEVLRTAQGEAGTSERICEDVLVALAASDEAMEALEQALVVARREGSRVYGLHVAEAPPDPDRVERIRAEFEARCRRAGVFGQFAMVVGSEVEQLLERSTWADLVVLRLPTDAQGQPMLSGAFRSFLRRCPRPVLVASGEAQPLQRALLAYDGSPRADTALFVAAYVAVRWQVPPVVLAVTEFVLPVRNPLARARVYLEEHGIDATYVERHGAVADAIVETCRMHHCDVILMGSYKYSRWLESFLGGVLEEVLSSSGRAVLVT